MTTGATYPIWYGRDLWNQGTRSRLYPDRIEATALPGTEGTIGLFFSPNGKWVGFGFRSKAGSQLKKVSLAGGRPQAICDLKDLQVVGATWGPDGTIVLGTMGPLYRVSAQGGVPQSITTLNREKQELRHYLPQFLPGGKNVVFDIRSVQLSRAYSGALKNVLSLETSGWLSGAYSELTCPHERVHPLS